MLYTDFNFEVFERPNVSIADSQQGFLRGNMYNNEYVPYKGYNPSRIIAKNEKETIMLKLYEYDFALNDLSLYLDINPDNKYVYKLFQKYVESYEKAKEEYERKYGPLVLTDDSSLDYEWASNPFPWESEDTMYV